MNKNRVLLMATVIVSIPLILFAYLGSFARYLADDYCVASKAHHYGVIGSTIQWYMTWAGQYTNWLVKGVVGSQGPGFSSLLAMIILLGWIGATTWIFYQIAILLRFRLALRIAVLQGLTLTYILFSGAPSVIQSFYWLSASIPYTLPLIILVTYLGFFLWMLRMHPDGKIPLWALVFTAGLTFIIGGTSESYVLIQGAILALTLLATFFIVSPPLRQGGITLLSVGLIFSLLAFIVILIAPGNAIRQAAFGTTLPLTEIIMRTLRVTASFFATEIAIFSPIPLLVAFCSSIVIISQFVEFERPILMTPRRVRSLMALSLGVGLLLIVAVIGPPIYATSVAPAPRVYFAAHLVMVCLVGFWGCLIGVGMKRRGTLANNRAPIGAIIVLIIVLVIGPGLATLQNLNRVSTFSTFATEWDKRDTFLRESAAQGVKNVEVQPLSVDLGDLAGLDIIDRDASGWVNICAAEYYNVESIRVASN